MKKYSLFFGALALCVSFASCEKEAVSPDTANETSELVNNPTSEGFTYVFGLGNADAPDETKASLGTEAGSTLLTWDDGDRIGTKAGATSGYSSVKVSAGTATFSIYSTSALEIGDFIYCYYPYSSTQDIDNIEMSIPAEQTMESSGFDVRAIPMISLPFEVKSTLERSENNNTVGTINFANLSSLIDFRIFTTNSDYASETISWIQFESTGICGDFSFTGARSVDYADKSTLAIPTVTGSTIKTSFDIPPVVGGSKAEAVHAYMAIAPGSHGGTVTVKTNIATYTYTVSAKEFNRSMLKPLNVDLKNAASRTTPPMSTFEKVTSAPVAPDNWDGTYIIVSTDGAHMATGSVSGSYLSSVSVTPALDGSITCLDEYALEITEESTEKYSIANSEGQYLSWTSGDGTKVSITDVVADDYDLYTLSISSGNAVIKNIGSSNRYIRWNGSSDFRMYTSSNGNNVDIYKKVDPRVLTSITLSGTYPVAFYKDDPFSFEGLVVTAHYDNGTERAVTPASITGYDMSAIGTQTVTVSYTEKAVTKTATYDITISARPLFTVTYSDGGSDTEASAGAGVTLPVRSDNGDWKFQGWSEAEIASETATVPTILTGTYNPVANITLYPVYKKTTSIPGTPTWNNTTSLVAGKNYVFGAVKAAASKTLADNTTFGAVAFAQDYNSSSDTWADYVDITPSSTGAVSNASVTAACKWELVSITDGNYVFKKGEKYLYLADTAGGTSAAQCGLNTSGSCYLENVNATCKNAFLLHPTSSSTKVMLYNVSSKGYRMYAPRSYSATMSPYIRFYVETPTSVDQETYISDPAQESIPECIVSGF